jgi:glycosyltransferase involved in cell wall biosynthesis
VPREKLSAIVTSFNEAINIKECLESVTFADEVLLVDSFSTDSTLDLARQVPGVRILQREYFGSAAQKNWAMDQTVHPWVLIVDADERVTPGLAREIRDLLERGPEASFYSIRRRNLFLDRLIRHSGWSTDKVVRLLRRGAARYPRRRVHADIRPEAFRRAGALFPSGLEVCADVRVSGRFSGRPSRPRAVHAAGVRGLSQVGETLGVAPVRSERVAIRAPRVR